MTTDTPIKLADRYLLTRVGPYTLVFPATWVLEILRITQDKILQMPQYHPAMIGIVHHQGGFIPLVWGQKLLLPVQSAVTEQLTIIRMSESAHQMQNTGIVVDRVLGNTNQDSLPKKLLTNGSEGLFQLLTPTLLPANLWQPRCMQP
jgi:chemotaxis signal transduction protein